MAAKAGEPELTMEDVEPTLNDSDSQAEDMARVPLVGRLHLYLPQLPTRSFSYFNSSTPLAPVADSNTPAGSAGSEPAPPLTPPESEPEKELQEIELMEFEEEEAAAVEIAEEVEVPVESISTNSSKLYRRRDVIAEELANTAPFLETNSQEYLALFFSFLFLVIESFLRIITLALPTPVINFFYGRSRSIFNSFSAKRYTTIESPKKEKDTVAAVRDADGFVDLCELWNDGSFTIEEHVVQTGDGYLLGLHRVVKKSEEQADIRQRRRRGENYVPGNGGKKVVYLHHGLLMNSEVWVCLLDKKQCLPFVLAEKGYDVWLGNNRGNKYSKKSIHHPSSSAKFWDFSIDDFAFYDIPDSINYILETTDQPSLSYIGFSQGTAQAFATLSIHPKLNDKIDVFIALAPAMSPAGLSNTVVDALMKASPNLMYLFFGRKSILSSTTFWQSVLYPPIFVRVIDLALDFLFKWSGRNISLNQKLAAYTHLYSYTSVKSVVHWFQIIRNRCFQMYDDDIQSGIAFTNRSFYKVAKFPTKNITAPICLVFGGSDSLVDIEVMLKELPSHTVATEVSHFEHLDFLWGQDIEKLVFPHVLNALEKHSLEIQEEKPPTEVEELPAQMEDEKAEASDDIYEESVTPISDTLPTYSKETQDTQEEEHTEELEDEPVEVVEEAAVRSISPPESLPEETSEPEEKSDAMSETVGSEAAPASPIMESLPDPPVVTSKEQAPVAPPITPPQTSSPPAEQPRLPPTGPASRSPPRGPALLGKGFFPNHSRHGSPLNRSVTSSPSTPSGLMYPPPRGPAAQALTYERPRTPMLSKRSSFNSVNGIIGNGRSGLVPDAALYPSTPSPPTGPRSPPTGPRSPPTGPRAQRSSPMLSGGSDSEYSPRGKARRTRGSRGGRGRGSPGSPGLLHRGNGEARMDYAGGASLYSDSLPRVQPW